MPVLAALAAWGSVPVSLFPQASAHPSVSAPGAFVWEPCPDTRGLESAPLHRMRLVLALRPVATVYFPASPDGQISFF